MAGADRAGSPAAHDRHAARMANDRPGNVRRMVAGRKQRPPSDDIGRKRQGGMGRSRVTAPCGQRPLQTGDGMPSRLPGAAFADNRCDNLWCEWLQKKPRRVRLQTERRVPDGQRRSRWGNGRGKPPGVRCGQANIVRIFAAAKPPPVWGGIRLRGVNKRHHATKQRNNNYNFGALHTKNKNSAPSAHFPLTTGGLTDRYTTSLLGCRSIGRTADSGSANLGSSPSSPANMRSHRLAGLGQRPFTPSTGVQIPLGTPPRHQRGHGSP